jgi:4-phytase / acid phosphatase
VLFLVGHDTNLATVAGVLGLNWIVDGRRDDTPPGSALLFELWRSSANGKLYLRIEFTAQTLDQMRDAKPLSVGQPPITVPVFVPGCSQENYACGIERFQDLSKRLTGDATTK